MLFERSWSPYNHRRRRYFPYGRANLKGVAQIKGGTRTDASPIHEWFAIASGRCWDARSLIRSSTKKFIYLVDDVPYRLS